MVVKCTQKCFGNLNGRCTVLKEPCNRACPFKKANRNYTNGVYYPYDSWYAKQIEHNHKNYHHA